MNINNIDKKITQMMRGEITLAEPDPKMLEDLLAFRENGAHHLVAIKEYNLRCRQLIDSGFTKTDVCQVVSAMMLCSPDKTIYAEMQNHMRPDGDEKISAFIPGVKTPKFIKYEPRNIWDLLFFKRRIGWECTYSDIYGVEIDLPEDIRNTTNQMLEKRIFDTISVVRQTKPKEDPIKDFLLFGLIWCTDTVYNKRLCADFYLGHYET